MVLQVPYLANQGYDTKLDCLETPEIRYLPLALISEQVRTVLSGLAWHDSGNHWDSDSDLVMVSAVSRPANR